jgi:predicted NAD/FAD-binding protein
MPRVAIVGAGAAGVFTAYRLREMYGDGYDIELFEANGRVGGNTYTTHVEYGGTEYSIDCGAQFFSRNPQPSYTQLIEDLGLFEQDGQVEIIEAPAGFLVWDAVRGERRFWLPSRIVEFLQYDLADAARLVHFTEFILAATKLDRESSDWTQSVDEWFATLSIPSDFKEDVLKPFLYQFVSLPYARIGEASALYAITYFVRNLWGEPGAPHVDVNPPDLPGLPTFQTYQSLIGLDGILKRALAVAGVTPRLSSGVVSMSRIGAQYELTISDGSRVTVDHVVFGCDPHSAAAILESGAKPPGSSMATFLPLVDSLRALEYIQLDIEMQKDAPTWMPPDPKSWEPVTQVVHGQDIVFNAWFGPLRPRYDGKQIPVFKSWGAPNLSKSTDTFLEHQHFIPLPTTTFMEHRAEVAKYQGALGVWFVGGWTRWFDSQEAALDSATLVADAMPGVPKVGTGRARMVPVDHDRIERNVRSWVGRVNRRAEAKLGADFRKLVEDAKKKNP